MEWFSNLMKKEEKNHKNLDEKTRTVYTFINKQTRDFVECVICLEEMKNGDKLSIIPCSHMYHSSCLEKWAKKKKVCPLCDKSF